MANLSWKNVDNESVVYIDYMIHDKNGLASISKTCTQQNHLHSKKKMEEQGHAIYEEVRWIQPKETMTWGLCTKEREK